ncbi:type I restriction endonuclease, partial [Thiolapillus sp.]|uniref:type I restriction endonuclease n=1 Tax=Thiolapillus sp. TaxID=2017437 RepID=UPI003AF659AF
MPEAHHEIRFEEYIVDQLKHQGWLEGDHRDYDRARALYPEDVIGWIRDTQHEAWEKLRRVHGVDAESTVLDRLGKTLAAKTGGTLEVLRRGFSVAGAGTLAMSQARPEDSRNQTVNNCYAANRLRVVRQLRYSLDNENAIDLVFFINGLPVATVEIKTDFTQSVEAAKQQYRVDRKPKSATTGRMEPLLSFRRGAVVHFALSDSEIHMTTKLKLAGESTFFLPFNRGNDGAAGNPPAPEGEYPVSYFWNWILQRD